MKISVIGLGYVGLSTALVFASQNIQVIGIDVNLEKIKKLKNGKIPIQEPKLQELLNSSLRKKCVFFTSDYSSLDDSDLIFICVGTPTKNKKIDLSNVKKSIKKLTKELPQNRKHTIVIKSTIIPGTCDKISNFLSRGKLRNHIDLLYNPEFLREGNAILDTLHPDRIVIGCKNKKSARFLLKLYQKILGKKIPVIMTSFVNAEFIKYASNAFLAMKISFANSIADLCEKTPNSDIGIVMTGIGLDSRISKSFLNAGVGFGGSCLPKDLQALISYSNELRKDSEILKAVMKINKLRPRTLVNKANEKIGNLRRKRIALLGLSFKPNTDDIRHAPSIEIIKLLLKQKADVVVYDPQSIPKIKLLFKDSLSYAKTVNDCVKNADCCIVITEWDEFKKLSPISLIKLMKKPVIIDGRRVFSDKNTSNIDYFCVGKGKTA